MLPNDASCYAPRNFIPEFQLYPLWPSSSPSPPLPRLRRVFAGPFPPRERPSPPSKSLPRRRTLYPCPIFFLLYTQLFPLPPRTMAPGTTYAPVYKYQHTYMKYRKIKHKSVSEIINPQFGIV